MSDAPILSTRPAPEQPALAHRVRSALAWRWGTQVMAQIITWASTIAVVRLLSPADYGLFAMSQSVITALAFLNGQSFATSLIQADNVDDRRIAQVFGLLLLLNGALACAQLMIAPWAARYYAEPMIAHMLRVQAIIFLTIPFAVLPQELLARRIEFKNQGMVTLVSATVSAVTALALAWLGLGVWALVYAPIMGFATRAIGLTIVARLLVRPIFDFRGAGDLVSFGGVLTICQLLWIIQSQSDIVIAGRSLNAHDLGLYSESLFLSLIITGRFLPPINEVSFPTYAELFKTGRPLGPMFLRVQRTVSLIVAPAYIGLSLVAGPAVLTLFGPKWANMAPIVSGLALAMPFYALQIVCSPATNGMGRPRVYLAINTAGALIFPALFLIGIHKGAMGLVHAWWMAAPALLAFTYALVLPRIGVQLSAVAAALAPAAASAAVMALAVFVVRAELPPSLPPPIQLAILAATGGTAYIATLLVVGRGALEEIVAFLTKRTLSPN